MSYCFVYYYSSKYCIILNITSVVCNVGTKTIDVI